MQLRSMAADFRNTVSAKNVRQSLDLSKIKFLWSNADIVTIVCLLVLLLLNVFPLGAVLAAILERLF